MLTVYTYICMYVGVPDCGLQETSIRTYVCTCMFVYVYTCVLYMHNRCTADAHWAGGHTYIRTCIRMHVCGVQPVAKITHTHTHTPKNRIHMYTVYIVPVCLSCVRIL